MNPKLFNRGDLQNIAVIVRNLLPEESEEKLEEIQNAICDYKRPKPEDLFSFLVNVGTFFDLGRFNIWVKIQDIEGYTFFNKSIGGTTDNEIVINRIKAECVKYLSTIQDDIGEITKEKVNLKQDFSLYIGGAEVADLNL